MQSNKQDSERWQIGGLTSIKYGFDRPLELRELYRPARIEIDGDRLVCPFKPFMRATPVCRPLTGILEGFTSLANASAEQICAYARRFGILWICEHSLPRSHSRCNGLFDKDQFFEPLNAWRSLAMRARSILNLAAKLSEGQTGNRDDWNLVLDYPNPGEFPKEKRLELARLGGITSHRALLAKVMGDFLNWARPEFELTWHGSRYVMSISSQHDTFLAIGLELAFAISGTAGLAFCSGCGKTYQPSRRPNPNRNQYCSLCGRSAAIRDAGRRWRQKQTEQPGR